jgi:hypothetical protein
MKKWRSAGTVFLVVMISMLSGCASGPSFKSIEEIPQGKGLIYVYREGGIVGSAISYEVFAGTEKIGRLLPGGYLSYFANPGELEIWAKTEAKGSITLDVKAGETQYVKGSLSVGMFVGRPTLMVVDTQVGQTEIAECKQNASK